MVINRVSRLVLGGLIDIQSQGSTSVSVNDSRWYRIAQATLKPNYPSSLLINLGNSYGSINQRHALVYVVLNGYGENIVSKIASTSNKLISKIRIVKQNTTESKYNYVDIFINNGTGENKLYISASNMIGTKLISPIDVTEQQLPDGYTAVEFNV